MLMKRYFNIFGTLKIKKGISLKKAICLYLYWLSTILRKDLFSQIFDFLLFTFMNLFNSFNSEKKLKFFLIKEIIEDNNYSIINQIFIKFHINLNFVLNQKNYHHNNISIFKIKKLYRISLPMSKKKSFQDNKENIICKPLLNYLIYFFILS